MRRRSQRSEGVQVEGCLRFCRADFAMLQSAGNRIAGIVVVLVAALLTCASPFLGQAAFSRPDCSGTIVGRHAREIGREVLAIARAQPVNRPETFAARGRQFTFMNVPPDVRLAVSLGLCQPVDVGRPSCPAASQVASHTAELAGQVR